jgi:hypothetical protein
MSDYVIYITLSFVFIVMCVACICDEGYIIIDRDYYANEVDENVSDVIIDVDEVSDDDNGFDEIQCNPNPTPISDIIPLNSP